MPKLIDLTGQKFGRWTVLQRVPNHGKAVYWLCECECGTRKEVKAAHLRSGASTSCGCRQKEIAREWIQNNIGKRANLTGQKFNHLTALKCVGTNKSGTTLWECECDCANHTHIIVSLPHLTSGHTTSCGCIGNSKGENVIKDILSNNNINFIQEKSFKNCVYPKTQGYLRFDFYLPEYNTCIEYDGEQHFKQKPGWEPLDQLQARDEYKNNWCKEHKVNLIRIPYTHYNNIQLIDLLPNTSMFKIV